MDRATFKRWRTAGLMRRSPPASNQLPALAERKRRHAELTPAAADAAADADADADAATDLRVWTELPCVSKAPLCTAAISPVSVVSVVSASVRAPPRLVTLES